MSFEFKEGTGRILSNEEIVNFVKSCSGENIMGIPSGTGEDYQKVFAECLINQLQGLTQRMSRNEKSEDYSKPPSQKRNENGVPLELMHQIRALSDILQYTINCSSWRSGEYHSFDALELKNKIGYAASFSDVALMGDK